MEHKFTTYVRTKIVFKHRLKDLNDYDSVKIHVYELKKLGCDNGPLLFSLRQRGEIWYDNFGNFKVLQRGPIDPALLDVTKKWDKVRAPLTNLHRYMREQLMKVETVAPLADLPVYFKAFLEHRGKHLSAFFSVDAFSFRVHTPVVNLKTALRHTLRLDGSPVVSLDVKQMQPTILAKILQGSVGENPFSSAIFRGDDVYVTIQNAASLDTRPEAKKMLFQLIFGKPMDDIGKVFQGDTKRVDWINSYKSTFEAKNPHGKHKHTNLAWLLQYSEVKVMTQIWEELQTRFIPFLTIHDDVLCRDFDKDLVFDIMDQILSLHFPKYTIVTSLLTVNEGEKE